MRRGSPARVPVRAPAADVAALWNLYGPTETTIWSSASRVEMGQPITLGRPIANTRFLVLDSQLKPVPIGVPGELFIGGDGLARGYLDQPELTAERFIPDPFEQRSQGRLYRTGDSVRYRADGCLEYLGRLDQQVKIRGHRIELGEIEAVLLRHPRIKDVVVTARKDGSDQNRLVAYIVPRDKRRSRSRRSPRLPRADIAGLHDSLGARDPRRSPLTANGKLDRRSLPAPGVDDSTVADGFTAPRTDVEKRLADIWAKTLRVKHVGYCTTISLNSAAILCWRQSC